MASRRNLIIAAGVVGAGVYFFPRAAAKVTPNANAFQTPGVTNIGDRFSAGGGSNTHTPGVATPRGNAAATTSNQETMNGVGTSAFEAKHGDMKSPKMDNTASKAYRNAMLGNDKGK
ncbi:hypothetical protein B0A48_07147 [Cryoendolithus antarcticus]|uniref:Uncharacterized protein n=1 Tax=Cryoendolithus antarcticus TaxID=1507870 RepID=A0A1V8T7W8_9PEZI|nr:hypothetical protein B0A48_07147 [Cryoendolithus antarcticus]